MALDIENLSGADADAFRAVIAQYAGHALVSQQAVSSPVEYVEVALPEGYSQFELRCSNIVFGDDADDWFAGAMKVGSVWANASDSYTILQKYLTCGGAGTASSEAVSGFQDAVFPVCGGNGGADPAFPTHAEITIYPGSATVIPRVIATGICKSTNHTYHRNVCWLFPEALAPPTIARLTALRLLPYGNADVNPPTSDITIAEGTFTLFGIPSD